MSVRFHRSPGDAAPHPLATGITPDLPPRPGRLASAAERRFWEALHDGSTAVLVDLARSAQPQRVAAAVYAAIDLVHTDAAAQATDLLDAVWRDARVIDGDPVCSQYFARQQVEVTVVPGVITRLPLDGTSVGLLYVELLQQRGDLQRALAVATSLEYAQVTRLRAVDLLVALEQWQDVIDATDGIGNTDDASAMLLAYRGMAFRALDDLAAAHECLTRALRSRSRAAEVRHRALAERAVVRAEQGRRALASADLARIRAEDAGSPRLAEAEARLAAIPTRARQRA